MHKLGEYEIVRAIARGGMGTIFEVRNPRSNHTYAAKVMIRPDDAGARERFQREAELLARCDRHPGVVKVHAIGEAPGDHLYMILDLVRGEDLGDVLTKKGELPARRAAEIAREIADALAFVHKIGIVHRDVKPSNVLLDEKGHCHLTDFGVATAKDLEKLTKTGMFIGTLRFVAPEQAAGAKAMPASDVFAVGCILYRALTGDHVAEELDGNVYLAWLTGPNRVPDVRDLAPETPEPLAKIVAKALEKDHRKRYPSGRELANDLGAFLADRPLAAGETRGARRFLAATLGALVVFAAALAFMLVVPGQRVGAVPAEPTKVTADPAAGRVEKASIDELAGDAAMIASDWKGAADAYGRSLKREPRLRIKRCQAAALAGDEKTSTNDLVPLLATTPNDPRLAPALYRRAMAARDAFARRRDLDMAYTLAPPPPAFARDVAFFMNEIATEEARLWGEGVTERVALTEQDMEKFRPIYALLARAYQIEANLPKEGFGNLLRLLRALTKTIEKKKIEHFARLILADWPREPLWLYLLGNALQDGPERDKREALRAFELASDGYRPAPPNEEPEVKHLAGEIARNMLSLAWRLQVEPDFERCTKMTDRAEEADVALALCEKLRHHGKVAQARVAFGHAREWRTYKEQKQLTKSQYTDEECALLWSEGKKAEVVKKVAKLKDTPGYGLRLYARYATLEKRWQDVVDAVSPATDEPWALVYLCTAFLELGREADAAAALQRLETMKAPKEEVQALRLRVKR